MTYASKFFGDWYDFFVKAMDALQLQQKLIAQNIANVDTPNYHPVHVSFEKQLQELLAKDSMGGNNGNQSLQVRFDDFDPEFHAGAAQASFKPEIITDTSHRVNLNQEMSELAKAQFLYNFSAVYPFQPTWTKMVIQTFNK